VIFLHGRHSSCYSLTTLKSTSGWPCAVGSTPILSYAGYDGAGDALAADGYTVISIGADAINAFDGANGADAGAVARGQSVLDTLTWLKSANAGQPVTFHDTQTNTDVNLDQALVAGEDTAPAAETLTAAQLVGTMDFSKIGLMGHSRGGEGVVTAGVLNEGLAQPWAIKSIFALAPIDFTRATLPDVITTTLLPYCDGDVSDQQGEHFYADSRNTFSDNVARSDIWVMGTDHDFYNTSWTPPYPGASDDWSASSDPVCGTSSTALASGRNIRLTAAQEFQVGSAYVAGFFELTLGGQTQFQGMFDGSELEPPSVTSYADVRTVVQQPSSQRDDIADFATLSPLESNTSTAIPVICANRFARTAPEAVPSCTTAAVNLSTAAQPYWTPASDAPNVPLNQLTHLTWTALTGSLGVTIPTAKQNVSGLSEMTVSMSPDENVITGTDMTVTVTDRTGKSWSSLMSALNPWTVTRMPGVGASTNLYKIVLQQAHVPTATLAAAGLDLTKIAKVTFTAATGVDALSTGGVYLQDLAFDSKGLGVTSVHTRSTVNVASTKVDEGNGPGVDEVAVYLSQPAAVTTSAWVSVLGSVTGKAGAFYQKVTFAPGQTCQSVVVPMLGDALKSSSATSSIKFAVSDSSEAVLGTNDFGTITIREDDGTTGSATPAPPDGDQGDACAEFAALSTPGMLTASDTQPAAGTTDTLTGSGYRSGESVTFSIGGELIGSVIADGTGTATLTGALPADLVPGSATISATGAGSGYTDTTTVSVITATTTTLTIDPAAPKLGQAVTLTATIAGAGTDGGAVSFAEDGAGIGLSTVTGGVATLSVPAGFTEGAHALTATFGGTATAHSSSSNEVDLFIKSNSTFALTLSAASFAFGVPVTGTISVSPATSGTATITFEGATSSATIDAGTGTFSLPGPIAIGSHTVSAAFDGSSTVNPSDPISQTFDVTKAPTTVSANITPTALLAGGSISVTITVRGIVPGFNPTGSVTITDSIGKTIESTIVLPLTSGDAGVLKKVSVPMNFVGANTILVTYNGDANYLTAKTAKKTVTVS
jgi:hypothetical protein